MNLVFSTKNNSMKIKAIFLFSLFSAVYFPLSAQQPVSWETLKDVTWSRQYVASLSDYFQMPDFGRQVASLDNKSVTIQGFYVPVDVDGTIFALSETPSYMCFFCGVGGIETVMEIVV